MATSISGRSGTKTTSRGMGFSANYKGCNQNFQNKIASYKTLYQQTTGTGRYPRPSTATLNTFANWINKGAVVQTVSCAQLARWAKSANKNFNSRKPTVTACKTVLTAKFGKSPIKACARTKTGSFMVATVPTWKGKTFKFPK